MNTILKNCISTLNTLLKHLLHLLFLSNVLVMNRLNHKSPETPIPTLRGWLASVLQDLMESVFLISSWGFMKNFLLDLYLGCWQVNQEQASIFCRFCCVEWSKMNLLSLNLSSMYVIRKWSWTDMQPQTISIFIEGILCIFLRISYHISHMTIYKRKSQDHQRNYGIFIHHLR